MVAIKVFGFPKGQSNQKIEALKNAVTQTIITHDTLRIEPPGTTQEVAILYFVADTDTTTDKFEGTLMVDVSTSQFLKKVSRDALASRLSRSIIDVFPHHQVVITSVLSSRDDTLSVRRALPRRKKMTAPK